MKTLSALIADGLDGAQVRIGTGELGRASALLERSLPVTESDDADTVVTILTNDEASLGVLLSCVVGQVRLVSLPLPGRGQSLTAYLSLVQTALTQNESNCVLARSDIAAALRSGGVNAHDSKDAGGTRRGGRGFELVQYTSGTTGAARAICLTDEALGYNVTRLLETLQPTRGDSAVSWLPLSHDMGLIGMVLTTIAAAGSAWGNQSSLTLLSPEDFLRRPAVWMEAIAQFEATFTAGPDFGYRRAAQHPTAIDLSRLRVAIVGGEIVRADTLATFAATFGEARFDTRAFCPAYGLAEVGLCATITPPNERFRTRSYAVGPRAVDLVSSGPQLRGYEIVVAGRNEEGPIEILTKPKLDCASIAEDGERSLVVTGDRGFLEDGWLYVLGRTDDIAVVNGRKLYLPAILQGVGEHLLVRAGRCVAFDLPTGELVIAAELRSSDPDCSDGRRELVSSIRRKIIAVAGVAPDVICIVPPSTLPLTASGKLRTRACREVFLSGEWEGFCTAS